LRRKKETVLRKCNLPVADPVRRARSHNFGAFGFVDVKKRCEIAFAAGGDVEAQR